MVIFCPELNLVFVLGVGRNEHEAVLVVYAIGRQRLYPYVEADRAEFRFEVGKHIPPYFVCAFHIILFILSF